jgi:nitroreductase
MGRLAALHAMKKVKNTKLTYRLNANRKINGAKSLRPKVNSDDPRPKIKVAFQQSTMSIMENAGTLIVYVERTGNLAQPVSVTYATENLTGFVGVDFGPIGGTLKFEPNEKVKSFDIEIIDNDEPQPDRDFNVVLSNLTTNDIAGD